MTGPDHYREAQRLVEGWQQTIDDLAEDLGATELQAQFEQGQHPAAQTLAAAQVHATLALAAATATDGIDRYRWAGVAW